MRSLLWKEWHEQRWKLAFTSLLLAGFAFCGLHARVIPDADVFLDICLLAVVLLPMLIGAVLIAAEREARTLSTLLALPLTPQNLLAVKTLVGIVLCVSPLAVACTVGVIMAGGREMVTSAIIAMFVRCMLTALALFFWTLSLTIRLPGETRSTLLGLGVLIGWMTITLGLSETSYYSPWANALALFDPLVFLLGHVQDRQLSLTLAALIQAAVTGLLWFWAARQLSAEEA